MLAGFWQPWLITIAKKFMEVWASDSLPILSFEEVLFLHS